MQFTNFSKLAAAAMLAMAVSCTHDNPTSPSAPLAGLNKATTNDTTNTAHFPTGDGPGNFRGTVLGQSPPGSGPDTLASAPRIAGVVVTIYERKPTTGDVVEAGDVKGSVTTGSDGLFTLPTLPAGEYVVTVVPPVNSGYYGVYVRGELHQNSSDWPWWVVLHKKP